ncbi:MAG: RNA-guided pseudouridylation complex pseudouridine synthase subunit Cbf5 [Methanomassiliicoccales archaeon]|jgi:H/ACA ribonucleoprotein complex subunit 4|nr:RNA-guided pseudouridylation complex pseudouridine synthase subunit Cbf5 [Methanomassiliicoccales archaeon]HOO03194.1 RNA-guided pseudouridylation complex pseudouridine synthase subunit Cbf5 [Methanomassiliicoccales archaeon]HRU11283.1 RNA-guided pseudouridylation complex pseudouridine synthase subunit Cbf5 [Methanomassiliicoccales archaeon]
MLVRDKGPRTLARGKRPEDRTVEELLDGGVIVLDKVQGPTSHQVTAWVKDILGVERIGHGGTLDPNVSGVLPIALGRAVRMTDLVLRSDKQYVCHMYLHRPVPEEKVREVIGTFVGPIYQTPPVRSAVKVAMRVRKVSSIDVLEVDGRDVLFKVDCDAGTYVRTLCVDIGEALGVGANMRALRRTRSGAMTEKEAVTLQELTDAVVHWREGDDTWLRRIIRPMEVLLEPLPKVIVKDSAVDAVAHGADLNAPGIVSLDEGIEKGAQVALLTLKGEALALGTATMAARDMHRAYKGRAVRTVRVFLPEGTYPRMWGAQQ